MTEPTQEEIERVAKEFHIYSHTTLMGDHSSCGLGRGFWAVEKEFIEWHLKKLEEQKAKYEKLVEAARLHNSNKEEDCNHHWCKLISDALSELESK